MPIVLADTTKELRKKGVSPLAATCKLLSQKEIISRGLNAINLNSLVVKLLHIITYMEQLMMFISNDIPLRDKNTLFHT